ncbi:hypothetical protein SAICODRAFT_144859 [Saitoella complicata NRRL Y-17804]|nr:uncharacterized protein SAICODRAFT_144859 [Saitoella complicata NRRL Y-17804]ODQ51824.1 hypothetical protein SAICODRAFT_144859 [Saitoella complicata NRRL Y-17804]
MSKQQHFTRLIRFVAKDGKRVLYGDAILPCRGAGAENAQKAKVIKGDPLGEYEITDEEVEVGRLLAPLETEKVGTVRCLGLNYAAHAKESGMPQPKYPVLFYKPRTSLTGPMAPIPVPTMAQQNTLAHASHPSATASATPGSTTPKLDYEVELVIVIGKKCRDVKEEDVDDVVLGYAVGNDVSQRAWQIELGGGQWSHGKGFDGWAPWGPCITHPSLLSPHSTGNRNLDLRITCSVNAHPRQQSTTADMIFGIRKTVALLSRGVTLMPGDLIFTGTPEGVGMGFKPEGKWLRDGDVVEVGVEGLGKCKNVVVFEGGMGRARL